MLNNSGKYKSELVEKLRQGTHKVSFEDRVKELSQVQDRINDGFVFVKFIETRGGTELGINLVKEECNFNDGDFKAGRGNLHVVGTCELNYCKVKCVADVELSTRMGQGHLELVED